MISENSKRILVLDDDVEMRTVLDFLLSGKGYHVTHAASGVEAIALHRQNPFDLVILELLLTNNDGFETFTELRHIATPTRFIALSKSSWTPAEVYLQMARHLGARGTLAKPFTADQLVTTVQNVLGAH